MSQTVETKFGTGTVVDHEVIRGRVSYKVEGPGFSTWIEAAAMPMDFQMMPHPDDVQDNSVTLPYNPSPQSWVNPADQNIVPGEQAINPEKRTAPADSVDFQADGESYEPGPDPKLFATAGLSPEDIQAKLGPKYVNAFVEHDFTSLQARIDENPELVMAEYRERLAELVAQADQEYLERVGRNEALEASDHHIREAAWKDVRAKAVRLRHSGQVMTHAANPDVIAAQVTGDHGTYEVMVIRSNIFQGSSAVDSWTCECPWGQWAFQRSDKFMGRLCSHAYASLLELQSMTRSKTHNPRFRNSPGIGFDPSTLRNRRRSSRTAEAPSSAQILTKNGWETVPFYRFVQFEFDSGTVVVEVELDGRVQQLELPRQQFKMNTQSSRTAEAVDIGTKIFHRDYADIYGTVIEDDGTAYLVEGGPGGEYWIDHEDARIASRTAEMVDIRPVAWDPYSRSLMNKLRDLWEEGSRPGREKERNEEIRELVQELRDRGFATDGIMAARESFLSRPMGYEDIPDYGTSEDYIADHEMWKREDVTEPEFEYPAGGDHGVVNDLNDGGTSRTADVGWEEDYSGGDEFGGYEDPMYVDPMEREDWPEDDIVANFQRNAGWIMSENSEGSGGNDDIAAAAAAHLRTAGRNFTMAEQQALIDEDDGQPYDRSQLRLDGTHYL